MRQRKRTIEYATFLAEMVVLVLVILAFAAKLSITERDYRSLEQENAELTERVETLSNETSELLSEVVYLFAENVDLREELCSAYEELGVPVWHYNDGMEWNTISNCTVTAYCACTECCGKWSGGPTSSGVMPEARHTVAVDPQVIPLGSLVRIGNDPTVYVAQDTGSAIKGKHIDVFFDRHIEALEWGVQYRTVYWRPVE